MSKATGGGVQKNSPGASGFSCTGGAGGPATKWPAEWVEAIMDTFGLDISRVDAEVILDSLNHKNALKNPDAPSRMTDDELRAHADLRAHQRQLDQDGVEVGVSRQALDETLDAMDRMASMDSAPITVEALVKIIGGVPVRFKDGEVNGAWTEIPVYMPEHQAKNIARAVHARIRMDQLEITIDDLPSTPWRLFENGDANNYSIVSAAGQWIVSFLLNGEMWIEKHRAIGRLFTASPAMANALDALVSSPLRYNGNRIEIDCADHADAMRRVREARFALVRAKGVTNG